jgi:hypothetical protein
MVGKLNGARHITSLSSAELPALTAEERTFFSAVKQIFASSAAGQRVRVQQDGVTVEVSGIEALKLAHQKGTWTIELPTYVRREGFSGISIGGRSLSEQAAATPLSKQDELFFRRLKLATSTPIHVSGSVGVNTQSGSTGVIISQLRETRLSFRGGKWSFEAPRYVSQNDFRGVSVQADSFSA